MVIQFLPSLKEEVKPLCYDFLSFSLKIRAGRGLIAQSLMRPLVIVELKVLLQAPL